MHSWLCLHVTLHSRPSLNIVQLGQEVTFMTYGRKSEENQIFKFRNIISSMRLAWEFVHMWPETQNQVCNTYLYEWSGLAAWNR